MFPSVALKKLKASDVPDAIISAMLLAPIANKVQASSANEESGKPSESVNQQGQTSSTEAIDPRIGFAVPANFTLGANIQQNAAWPVIRRAVIALGGLDKIIRAGIYTSTSRSTTTIPGKGSVDYKTIFWSKYPGNMRQESTYVSSKGEWSSVLVYSNGKASGTVNGKPYDVKATEKAGLARSVFMSDVESLRPLLEDKYQVKLNEDSVIDGISFASVSVSSDNGDSVTLLFDKSSGLLTRNRHTRSDEQGKATIYEYVHSNYATNASEIARPTRTSYYENGKLKQTEEPEFAILSDIPETYFLDPTPTKPLEAKKFTFKALGGSVSGGLSFTPATPIKKLSPEEIKAIYANPKYGDIIIVEISRGEIGMGDRRYPYVPLQFEIARGDHKNIEFHQLDKPIYFRTVPVHFADDGSAFFIDPGMNAIEIKQDTRWRMKGTYYPKEIKDVSVAIGAKNIQISIAYKPVNN